MTGGGFGGCTVTLLKQESVTAAISHMVEKYKGTPTFYFCKAEAGAQPVKI